MFTQCLRNLPNFLSLSRIALTLPLVYGVLYVNRPLILCTLIVAAFTDWADGYIARRFELQTQLGAWLDPLADKIMLNSTFVALASQGIVPLWVAFIVVCRDCILVAGAVAYFNTNHKMAGQANLPGKISTFLQFGVLMWCLVLPSVPVQPLIFLIMIGLALVSCWIYIDIWGRSSFYGNRLRVNK